MAYNKHTWKDYEDGGTPITAKSLNEMEDGIYNAGNDADSALSEVNALSNDLSSVKTTYATKAQVPNLVKVDGNTITKDEDGTLHGTEHIEVDTQLSTTSTNPVENKAITTELNKKADSTDIPTSLPANGGNADTVNGHTVDSDVPADAVFTDTIYALPVATDTILGGVKVDNKTTFINSDGVLSSAGGSGGEGQTVIVDTELSTESTNPVENKVITAKVNTIDQSITQLLEDKASKTDVANTYATKVDVPKLVKVDNKTVFMASDGTLSAKTGGSGGGIKPKSVSNVSLTSSTRTVVIKWTDPTDIVIDDATLSAWKKTIVVYKQGTTAPTNVNDGTIAVEETTRNKYQSSGYSLTGLTDGNDYSFSFFVVSTDDVYSDVVTSTTKLYAVLNVTTTETTLYGKIVTAKKGSSTVTGTFSSSGNASLKIPWTGTTIVSASDGDDSTEVSVSIDVYGNTYTTSIRFVKIVTFANGTDAEISAMINAHYKNKLKLSDYWSVGDKRTILVSGMSSADTISEIHRAQNVTIAILDFDHDDLVTAVNGHTKAALSLTQVDCLMASNIEGTTNGSNNSENGHMNKSQSSGNIWKDSDRRAWCNNTYYNALPQYIRTLIKSVSVKSCLSSDGTPQITQDNVFLPSQVEVGLGSGVYSGVGEGTKYAYYNTTANRYKKPLWDANDATVTAKWWLRSKYVITGVHFVSVDSTGGSTFTLATTALGICPCFCM